MFTRTEETKETRSFSNVIRSLLRKRSNAEILMMAFGTGDDEADELKREIEEVDRWMQSLTWHGRDRDIQDNKRMRDRLIELSLYGISTVTLFELYCAHIKPREELMLEKIPKLPFNGGL